MKKIRVIFSKTDRMKYVSHLDMNRFFIRLMRMAKIPIWYTEGFNQHPYITFALPLSLGFESNYEIVDFKITDDNYSMEELLNALNSKAVPGIEFIDAFEENRKAKEICYSEYEVKFNVSDDAKNFYGYLTNSKEIFVDKTTKKGGTKNIEISGYIKSCLYDGENKVTIIIPAGSKININPTLYTTAYADFSGRSHEFSVLRTMIYDKELNNFR